MMRFTAHGAVFASEVVVFRRMRMPRKTHGVGAVGQQSQQRGSIDRRIGGTVGIVETLQGNVHRHDDEIILRYIAENVGDEAKLIIANPTAICPASLQFMTATEVLDIVEYDDVAPAY